MLALSPVKKQRGMARAVISVSRSGVRCAPATTSVNRAPVWPMPQSIPTDAGSPTLAINSGKCVDVPFETKVMSAMKAA
ncbi:hypothetical protein D3C81_1667170 [compost metagenome]